MSKLKYTAEYVHDKGMILTWSIVRDGERVQLEEVAELLNERDELQAAINRSPFVISPCQECNEDTIGLDGEAPWARQSMSNYFSFDGETFETHCTEAVARGVAEGAMEFWLDQASEGWDPLSTQVCYGIITHGVTVEEIPITENNQHDVSDNCEGQRRSMINSKPKITTLVPIYGSDGTTLYQGDCLEALRGMADDSVNLVMCSPPYEDARTYGMEFRLKGQDWVDWAVEIFIECCRVSSGLVVWVVEGRTRQFRWSATPALMMADLHRAGTKLRKPPIFKRHGIPGSGGPDYWRNDYESIIVASPGKLPWSDNTATGWDCKYPTGGAMSNRTTDGKRRNAKTGKRLIGNNGRPKITNPGNVLDCKVGKGHMGDGLAHENEAPFPESLVEPFVKSFCPPDGVVLDPFCGSGTTLAVAKKLGRNAIGIDIRASQIELCKKRLQTNDTAPEVLIVKG